MKTDSYYLLPFRPMENEPILRINRLLALATEGQLHTLARLADLVVNGADLRGATPVKDLDNAEDRIQADAFQWHNRHFRRVSLLFAVPNGGTRVMLEAMKLKATGTRRGVSDLILLAQDGKAYFIEMKAAKGTQEPDQKLFQSQVERLGFTYYLCYSLADFKALIYHLLAYAVEPGKNYT